MPQTGQTVQLTIDTRLQIAAQNALEDGIQRARNSGGRKMLQHDNLR